MSTFQKKGGIFSLSFFCCIYSFLAFTLHFTLLYQHIHSFLKYSPFKRPVWGFLTLILDISIFLCMWRPELCMCRPELCMWRPELWSKYWIKKPKMWEKQFSGHFIQKLFHVKYFKSSTLGRKTHFWPLHCISAFLYYFLYYFTPSPMHAPPSK